MPRVDATERQAWVPNFNIVKRLAVRHALNWGALSAHNVFGVYCRRGHKKKIFVYTAVGLTVWVLALAFLRPKQADGMPIVDS